MKSPSPTMIFVIIIGILFIIMIIALFLIWGGKIPI